MAANPCGTPAKVIQTKRWWGLQTHLPPLVIGEAVVPTSPKHSLAHVNSRPVELFFRVHHERGLAEQPNDITSSVRASEFWLPPTLTSPPPPPEFREAQRQNFQTTPKQKLLHWLIRRSINESDYILIPTAFQNIFSSGTNRLIGVRQYREGQKRCAGDERPRTRSRDRKER